MPSLVGSEMCVGDRGAQRIVAQVYAGNIYSARLCEKAGMQLYETVELEKEKQKLCFHLIC